MRLGKKELRSHEVGEEGIKTIPDAALYPPV